MLADGLRLLQVLYATAPADTFYELRALANGRTPQCMFGRLPIDERSFSTDAAWLLRLNDKGWGGYHCLHPRLQPAGKTEDVVGYAGLAVDLDSRNEGNEAIVKLAAAGLKPDAVVSSGRGGHLYLMLDALAPVDVGRPVARRLHAWVGGDSVFDAPRVLRTPGTVNHRVNLPCTLVHLDDHRYSLAEIVAAMDEAGAPEVVPEGDRPGRAPAGSAALRAFGPADVEALDPERRARLRAVRDRLPARALELMTKGWRPDGPYHSRSEAEMSVVRALVDAGADDDDIELFFAMCADGIGARAFEMGRFRLVNHAAAKARATPPPRPAGTEVEHVRVVQSGFDRKRNRLLLTLEVVHGRHAGAVFVQGIAITATQVVHHLLAAFGFGGPPACLESYLGREAVVLIEKKAPSGLLNVVGWLHPGAQACVP